MAPSLATTLDISSKGGTKCGICSNAVRSSAWPVVARPGNAAGGTRTKHCARHRRKKTQRRLGRALRTATTMLIKPTAVESRSRRDEHGGRALSAVKKAVHVPGKAPAVSELRCAPG